MNEYHQKFKKGNRVVVNAPHLDVVNAEGTVLGGLENTRYPVRLDDAISFYGHTCGGLCRADHGLYIRPKCMKLITNKEETNA